MTTLQLELTEYDELTSHLHFMPDLGQILLNQQRMVILQAEALGELRRGLITALGQDRAKALLTRMGFAAGARDACIIRKTHPDTDPIDLFKLGPRLHNLTGIVNVKPLKMRIDVATGACEGDFIWEDSMEARIHREVCGPASEPACWMQVGYASGYTSELFGKFVLYKETACAAMGGPHCHIVGRPLSEWGQATSELAFFDQSSIRGVADVSPRPVDTSQFGIVGYAMPGKLIGGSDAFQKACGLVDKVARSNVTVMLLGETGVGKEVFARRIHRLSERSDKAFVAINCAAIPENLIEAELFGVERGAFTGAARSRSGRFERAHEGTLFLDEVGELSAAAQAKLLRAIQEGEFERVGDSHLRRVDVRIIVATNVDLKQAIYNRQFREDLYYRLCTYPILIPPLRDRRADIPLLVRHFVDMYSRLHSKTILGVTSNAGEILGNYNWPGNIRELQNVIERSVILNQDNAALTGETVIGSLNSGEIENADPAGVADLDNLVIRALNNAVTLKEMEMKMIERAVEHSGGNLSSAARLLGLTRPQLAYRMKKE
jgi:transcriptional regulator with AAA-type ATPase domain/predicted hydrocarbon binding protein